MSKLGIKVNPSIPVTRRGIERYESRFGFKIEDLRGGVTLDIGSGKGYFQEQAALKGITVVGVDPHYAPRYHDKDEKVSDGVSDKVASVAEVQIFRDNSFGLVLSDNSLFYYFSSIYRKNERAEKAKMSLEVALREVKPEGRILIGMFHRSAADMKREKIVTDALSVLSKEDEIPFTWRFSKNKLDDEVAHARKVRDTDYYRFIEITKRSSMLVVEFKVLKSAELLKNNPRQTYLAVAQRLIDKGLLPKEKTEAFVSSTVFVEEGGKLRVEVDGMLFKAYTSSLSKGYVVRNRMGESAARRRAERLLCEDIDEAFSDAAADFRGSRF